MQKKKKGGVIILLGRKKWPNKKVAKEIIFSKSPSCWPLLKILPCIKKSHFYSPICLESFLAYPNLGWPLPSSSPGSNYSPYSASQSIVCISTNSETSFSIILTPMFFHALTFHLLNDSSFIKSLSPKSLLCRTLSKWKIIKCFQMSLTSAKQG